MNKKHWMILLLLLAVVAGTFLLKKRGTSKRLPEDTVPEGAASVEKDPEAEEFFYTEELVREVEDHGIVIFLRFDGKLSVVNCSEERSDGKYLTLQVLETGEELFAYPVEGEIMEQVAAFQDRLCFLEYRKDGRMILICLDGTGRKIHETPVKEREWGSFSGKEPEWKHYAWVKGANEEYFYLTIYDIVQKKFFCEIYQWDGTMFQEPTLEAGEDLAADGKGFHYIVGKGILKKFQTSTRELIYQQKIEASWQKYWLDTDTDTLYLLTRDSRMFRYRLSDGQVMDSLLTFGSDTGYIVNEDCSLGSVLTKDGDVYVHVSSLSPFMGGSEEPTHSVYRYVKVQGKKPERTKSLAVMVPYETESLRKAKVRFELKHLDTEVKLIAPYNSVDGFLSNQEQYREQMRMKMSAGDIGDIVEVGHTVDFYTMAKSDVFLDLKPYLEKSNIRKKLNAKLLRAYEWDGTIRGIPTEYIVHYYQFNRETAKRIGWTKDPEEWKWSDLLSLAKKLEEENSPEYLFSDPGEFQYRLINIIRANMPDMVDYEKKTVNLHEEWFMNLMKQLKEVNHSRNISYDIMNHPVKNPACEKDSMGDGMLYQEWQMSKLYSKLGNEIETAENRDVILVKNIRGEKNPNRLAHPQQVFSISANSTQKENAWDFLEILLEKPSQLANQALSINEEVLDYQWNMIRSQGYQTTVVKEYEKAHREIIHNVDGIHLNPYVSSVVSTVLKEYLDDKLGLEEALTKAENDVRIILNE